jgi:hypothetical protein
LTEPSEDEIIAAHQRRTLVMQTFQNCRTGCPYPVPQAVLNHAQAILNVFDNNRANNHYNAPVWRKWFPNDPDLAAIQALPNPITRPDIQGLSAQVSVAGYQNARRLFLASMIWGHVDDNRGPWKTSLMLAHPAAVTTITDAARHVAAGNLLTAYGLFCHTQTRLPRLGAAYFSKYLYFVGLGARTNPLPLILDGRVAHALDMISIGEPWRLDVFAKVDITVSNGNTTLFVRRYPEGYKRYVDCLNSWATELRCRADNIEFWLWLMG